MRQNIIKSNLTIRKFRKRLENEFLLYSFLSYSDISKVQEEEQINAFTVQTVDSYLIDYDTFNFKAFEYADELISKRLKELGESKTSKSSATEKEDAPKSYSSGVSGSNKYVPMNTKKRQHIEKMMNQPKTNKDLLFGLAQQRAQRKANQPELYQNNPYSVRSIEQQSYDGAVSIWDQLKAYRENMKKKSFYRPSKTITVSDLEKMNRDKSMNVDPNDIKRHGIRCLQLSNNFRKSEGKPDLIWNDELYKIAMEHSKNMAEGTVPFGHDGFKDRMNKVPFYIRSFSENVAYNSNVGDP